jgi:hypothetical protein
MTPTRELLPDGSIRFFSEECTVVVSRLAAGVVLLTLSGMDTGKFGTAPMDELNIDMARYGVVEVFVDTRDAFNATATVSSQWAEWIQTNRKGLKRMSVLVSSKFVQMTAEVMKLFSRTGELMRIYTDAPAFSDAMAQALGRPFALGPPRR